ncbi:hypothetical protein KJI95_10030 [Shewanella sp. JM162201]|uniref:Uncharacterized protein n=1 Tax=Shewanella jiangmenensis TaxID=2837387 RepID=A0ABS5V4U1_9GAMM|nr:hypothetical protein [Shewanella jiangmenensis]MBT1444860.1 hypothetical protein [Shewanella jiangmenensis]
MELKDFVKDTLIQICQGVNEAQGEVNSIGGYVNPAIYGVNGNPSHFSTLSQGEGVFMVDFDVAVTVSEAEKQNGQAKISVATFLNAGGGIDNSTSQSSVTKIAFKVPLSLPVCPSSKERYKQERRAEEEQYQNLYVPSGVG